MKLFDSFRSALQSIIVNKLRSALTMLGVIIGVASVVTMLALGNLCQPKTWSIHG